MASRTSCGWAIWRPREGAASTPTVHSSRRLTVRTVVDAPRLIKEYVTTWLKLQIFMWAVLSLTNHDDYWWSSFWVDRYFSSCTFRS